jgi:hypothetical protein
LVVDARRHFEIAEVKEDVAGYVHQVSKSRRNLSQTVSSAHRQFWAACVEYVDVKVIRQRMVRIAL